MNTIRLFVAAFALVLLGLLIAGVALNWIVPAHALLELPLPLRLVTAVTLAFLEVRPTNAEALGLYERFGFRVIGRRKGYYFDTGEDALVMEARLSGEVL